MWPGTPLFPDAASTMAHRVDALYFFLIGLTYTLTAVYSLLLRQAESRRWIVDVQLALDVLIVSAVVHMTGGVASSFSTLYMLPIIAASTIQSLRGGLMIGVLSSIIYSGLVWAQYAGPPPMSVVTGAEVLPPERVALYTVGLNVFGFIAVASLSGYLAEGLRRAGRELEEASNQIADLQAFSEYAINSLASGLLTTDLTGRVWTVNGTAFLTVLALVLFGGEVLKSFSWALLIGIVVGTYLTVYVASPVMLWWEDWRAKKRVVTARAGVKAGATASSGTVGETAGVTPEMLAAAGVSIKPRKKGR